jgi:hypothetical protein
LHIDSKPENSEEVLSESTMLGLFNHWYAMGEGITIVLVCLVVPLFFLSLYLVVRGTEKHGPNP